MTDQETHPLRSGPARGERVLKAISIRAPWWWMILQVGKDIENRDWATSYRGAVLIHASKWFGKQDVYDDFQWAKPLIPAGRPEVTLGDLRELGGHIVGAVDIVDCVTASDSPWFFGKFGFVLRNPRLIDPYPVKGALGFFTPEISSPLPSGPRR
jgi:hypothetical protein